MYDPSKGKQGLFDLSKYRIRFASCVLCMFYRVAAYSLVVCVELVLNELIEE